jgi:hypothetical protein
VYLPAIVIADQLSAKWYGRVSVIDEIQLYSFRVCRVRTQYDLVKTNFKIFWIPVFAGMTVVTGLTKQHSGQGWMASAKADYLRHPGKWRVNISIRVSLHSAQ